MKGYQAVTKIFSGVLLAGGVLCVVFAGILAFTMHSLDLLIFDIYFVILPRYLLLVSAVLLLAAFLVWKAMVFHT
jgi:hypothetical protein